ncbi:hypothetical protein OAO18_07885, partial [Francisellaceae bacterium]|nr:hypothetical protein [Francisellaceae bacterium]
MSLGPRLHNEHFEFANSIRELKQHSDSANWFTGLFLIVVVALLINMLIDEIRRSTKLSHANLENSKLLAPLSSVSSLTKTKYLNILFGLYILMNEIENCLKNEIHKNKFINKYLICNAHLLLQDYLKLGGLKKSKIIELNNDASQEHLLALLYFQKGSKLGAKQIYKNIKSYDGHLPCMYFEECKTQNTNWKTFCIDINA